ncbi:MAG: FecR family protein [Nitrospirae bacterium YQR-1]
MIKNTTFFCRKVYIFLVLAAILTFLGVSESYGAQPVGTITQLEGIGEILRGGNLPAVAAKTADPVYEKDVIRTKSRSKIVITFVDESVLTLAPNTRIDISEYSSDKEKPKTVINMPRGTVRAIVSKSISKRLAATGGTEHFEVHTPNAVAGVRGTDFKSIFMDGVGSVFQVMEGNIGVSSKEMFGRQELLVGPGQQVTVPIGKEPLPPTPLTDKDKQGYGIHSSGGGSQQGSQQALSNVANEFAQGNADTFQQQQQQQTTNNLFTQTNLDFTTDTTNQADVNVPLTDTQSGVLSTSTTTTSVTAKTTTSALITTTTAATTTTAGVTTTTSGTTTTAGATTTAGTTTTSDTTTTTALEPPPPTTTTAVVTTTTAVVSTTTTASTTFQLTSNLGTTESGFTGSSSSDASSYFTGVLSATYKQTGTMYTPFSFTASGNYLASDTSTYPLWYTNVSGSFSSTNTIYTVSGYMGGIKGSSTDSSLLYANFAGIYSDLYGTPVGVLLSYAESSTIGSVTGNFSSTLDTWSASGSLIAIDLDYTKGSYGNSFYTGYVPVGTTSYLGEETSNAGYYLLTLSRSDGVYYGKSISAYADTTGSTYLYFGRLLGKEGTGSGSTAIEYIDVGLYLSVSQFLNLACGGDTAGSSGCSTTTANTVLSTLNIPSVEIGRTSLSGTLTLGSDYVNMYMSNVVFFASSSGSSPAIFTIGSISGSYSFGTSLNTTNITNSTNELTLADSSSSLYMYLHFNQWSGNAWTATIGPSFNRLDTNSGGYLTGSTWSGNVNLSGAAGGAYTGLTSGSLSGNGAGIVTIPSGTSTVPFNHLPIIR